MIICSANISCVAVADLVKGTDTAKAAAVVIGPKWCKLKKDGTLRKKPGPPPADIPGYIRKTSVRRDQYKCLNCHPRNVFASTLDLR